MCFATTDGLSTGQNRSMMMIDVALTKSRNSAKYNQFGIFGVAFFEGGMYPGACSPQEKKLDLS